MTRPCFLVVDHEFLGSISTRKLVIETAKFNVITAYSFDEGLATLELFPRVHCVVVGSSLREPCAAFTAKVKAKYPEVKLVATGLAGPEGYGPVDRVVESYFPALLLEALRDLFPEQSSALERHEEELAE